MKNVGLLDFESPKNHTCIAKQEVLFNTNMIDSETGNVVEIKFNKLEECTFRFDKDNDKTMYVVTKWDGKECMVTRDTFNLYFMETDNYTPFLTDKEKILLVLYLNISAYRNNHGYEHMCQAQQYLNRTFDFTVKAIVIPVFEGETRLESLNPETIDDEKLAELNRNLDKWIETLKNHE